ncbi:uncharacterized protein LOC118882819 [Balaenoptera musculus]|uniref:Uncharacterized protein LOC118882819 n=1 Tax=Balaenoptera musculus TaxID=9771 RepID=A0A8B8VJJ8_BALMU|nr:uncharacterized protein LOC118882819 [Balaenoptera musculus]
MPLLYRGWRAWGRGGHSRVGTAPQRPGAAGRRWLEPAVRKSRGGASRTRLIESSRRPALHSACHPDGGRLCPVTPGPGQPGQREPSPLSESFPHTLLPADGSLCVATWGGVAGNLRFRSPPGSPETSAPGMRHLWRASETRKGKQGEKASFPELAQASSSPTAGQGRPEQVSRRGGRGLCGPGKRGLGRRGVAGGACSPVLLEQLGHLHLSGQSRDGLEEGTQRGLLEPLSLPFLLGSRREEVWTEGALSLFCENPMPPNDPGVTVEVVRYLRSDRVGVGSAGQRTETPPPREAEP